MRTTTIFGSWWGGNLGDTAILRSTVRTLRAQRGRADRILVHSSNPEVLAPALAGFDRVSVRPVWNSYWGPATPRSLAASDEVIVGGGGLFFSKHLWHPYRNHLVNLAPISVLARARGADRHVLCVGANPLEGAAAGRLARTVLDGSTTVTARDRASAEVLERHTGEPVGVVPDPAFALAPDASERVAELTADVPPDSVLLSLHDDLVRNWPDRDRDAVARAIVQRVDAYASERGRDVVLYNNYVFSDWLDGWADAFGPDVTVHPVETRGLLPEEAVALFAHCERAVCSQMHANLMSAVAETPNVAIEYDRKVRSLMETVDREEQVVGVDEVTERLPGALDACRPADDERIAELRAAFEAHVAAL